MSIAVVSAGNRLTASKVNELIAQINSLTAPGWTDYSASLTLTATTTNPTKGNSTYEAAYRRSASGDIVQFRGRITIGSTFAAGSGNYRISLPVTATSSAIGTTAGSGFVLDNGTANFIMVTNILTTTTLEMHLNNSLSGLGSAGPGTAWATGDQIRWSFAYQAA